MTSPQRCTYFDCTTSQDVPRFATYSISWPSDPVHLAAFVCDLHAERIEALQTTAVLTPLTLAPPLYGPPAKRSGKAPGEYAVESLAIGDRVRPYGCQWTSTVEGWTDLGGSTVLHLGNGEQLECRWGALVEVVEPTPIDKLLARARAARDGVAEAAEAVPTLSADAAHYVAPAGSPLADVQLDAAINRLADVLAEPQPVRPWSPPGWDCVTPGGASFYLSFDSIAQRDAVEAWWLARHDFCRDCEACGRCHHPDHEDACPDEVA